MSSQLAELAPTSLDMTGFETSIQEDIPCDTCDSKAVYRSFGHQVNDCGLPALRGGLPPFYLCADHYIDWRAPVTAALRKYGFLVCVSCHRRFNTAEGLSDFRKF